MELKEGTCFFCLCKKVIEPTRSEEVFKIISILLPREILNHNEFCKVQSALNFCPICYHKLIILKRINENIQPGIFKNTSIRYCFLCRTQKNLFQINNWTNLDAIFEDMVCPSKNINCVTCSDCLFFLETRNELKTRLFSEYPQLKNKPEEGIENRKKKFELKFTRNVKLHSPLLTKNTRRPLKKEKEACNVPRLCDISTGTTINFDLDKKLKPLKDYKLFRNLKIVKMDTKFLNQIPYVLINPLVPAPDTINETILKNAEESKKSLRETIEFGGVITIKNKKIAKKSKDKKTNTKAKNVEKTLFSNGIVKHLVINVSRINIENLLGTYKPDSESEVQNLIDKFSILQPLNQEENNSSNSIDPNDSFFSQKSESNSDTKNKRKSVSFAEENNVEIDYFQIKSSNSNSDENFEVIGKKYNKGILKHEENIACSSTTFEENEKLNEVEERQEFDHNDIEEMNKKIVDGDSRFELKKDEKIKTRRNTLSDSLNTSHEHEDIIFSSNESLYEENDRDEEVKTKRLSNQSTNIGDINDDNANANNELEKLISGETTNNRISPVTFEPSRKEQKPQDHMAIKNKVNEDIPLENENQATCENNVSTNISKNTTVNTTNIESEITEVESECKDETCEYDSLDQSLNESDIKNNTETDIISKNEMEVIRGSENQSLNEKNKEQSGSCESEISVLNYKISLDNSEDSVLSLESEINSLKSILGEKTSFESVATDDSSVAQIPECVLNKDEEDISNINIEPHSSLDPIGSKKCDSTSENEVTQLVSKYLISPNNDSFISVHQENSLKGPRNDNFHMHFEEKLIEGENDVGVKNDSITATSFDELEKSEELGISEVDNENINSILPLILPPEISEIREFNTEKNENNSTNESHDSHYGKRKRNDELNVSTEKKKKKVTFCEDVT